MLLLPMLQRVLQELQQQKKAIKLSLFQITLVVVSQFSTPVGLLPIACAGFDIQALVKGATDMEKETGVDVPFNENIAAQYAAVRMAFIMNWLRKSKSW